MAVGRELIVRVKVDEEKLSKLEEAEARFRAAAKELQDASDAVRAAMRELADGFTTERIVR